MIAASASVAQQPAADKDCGSVVIIKCAAPVRKGQQPLDVELRRQDPLVQSLEGIVIEGEATRRRSINEVMGSTFPEVRPRDGNHTFATGEGSKCTCMNVCPPAPLPCCTCSRQMGRYFTMPGSSPLN